jgi:hypothetical protein
MRFIRMGDRFGRLVVSDKHYYGPSNKRYVKCRCDCGKEIFVRTSSLYGKYKSSCGCLAHEMLDKQIEQQQRRIATIVSKHAPRAISMLSSSHPLYDIWQSMLSRSTKNSDKDYQSYGGRGIGVCARWLDFDNFVEDMGVRPAGRSLGRIDNNKGYSVENCRWETGSEQLRNTRRRTEVNYHGERLCLMDLCDKLGITDKHNLVRARLARGWTAERAVSVPAAKQRKFSKAR